MKNIKVFPISSVLKNDEFLLDESIKFLNDLEKELEVKFDVIKCLENIDEPILILVQTGGSELYFKDFIFNKIPAPYYLLTYGGYNSLAASLEILSFINNSKSRGEVLHGELSYISNRIKSIFLRETKKEVPHYRLGVFGKPSDWLISSEVDYSTAKKVLNVDLIDVPIEEVISVISETDFREKVEFCKDFDELELKKAYQIYDAFTKIITKYNLDGLTIRCFYLLTSVRSSACLALSFLNRDNIIGTCEGDIPSMLTSKVIMDVLGKNAHAFQANPQYINPQEKTVYFAHCTLPLDMCETIVLDSHFESNSAVAIHGKMKEGPATVVKLSNDLTKYYIEQGQIVENEYRKDRCRTQIRIKLNGDVSYFLKNSLGNHHLIIYGYHKEELENYFKELNLRSVLEE